MQGKYSIMAGALLLAVAASGTARAGEPVFHGKASEFIHYAVDQVKAEQKQALRREMQASWIAMRQQVNDTLLAQQPSGGNGNATVKAQP